MLERGQPGDVPVLDLVTLGTESGDGGVDVASRPGHDGVEGQAERAELVLSELAQPTARQGYARVDPLKVIV